MCIKSISDLTLCYKLALILYIYIYIYRCSDTILGIMVNKFNMYIYTNSILKLKLVE